MTITRVLAARCALLSVPVLLAGCSSPDAPAPAATSTMTSTSTTSTTSPTSDAEQQAVQDALALVPVYVQTLNGLFADPSKPVDDIYAVAVEPEATTEAAAVQAFRSGGYAQSGVPQVVSTTTGDIALDTSGESLPSVAVTACVDVSEVRATDANGDPLPAASVAPFLVVELTIVNIDYPDAASWRVSSAPNTQADACPG